MFAMFASSGGLKHRAHRGKYGRGCVLEAMVRSMDVFLRRYEVIEGLWEGIVEFQRKARLMKNSNHSSLRGKNY